MKQLRLKESLKNWSFWDKDCRLLVTCKATAFWRPRLCRFWLDFWVAKAALTSGADLSGSVFSQYQPAFVRVDIGDIGQPNGIGIIQ